MMSKDESFFVGLAHCSATGQYNYERISDNSSTHALDHSLAMARLSFGGGSSSPR